MGRKTSKAGIDLIKSFEGLRLTGYTCAAGKATVGFGHCGPEVKVGMVITQDEADRLLAEDLAKFEAGVNAAVKTPISQNQFDSLVSFSFNVGLKAFQNSTLLKLLNKRMYGEAAAQLERWCHANGGAVLPGLLRRRRAEKELFLTPDGPPRRNA